MEDSLTISSRWSWTRYDEVGIAKFGGYEVRNLCSEELESWTNFEKMAALLMRNPTAGHQMALSQQLVRWGALRLSLGATLPILPEVLKLVVIIRKENYIKATFGAGVP